MIPFSCNFFSKFWTCDNAYSLFLTCDYSSSPFLICDTSSSSFLTGVSFPLQFPVRVKQCSSLFLTGDYFSFLLFLNWDDSSSPSFNYKFLPHHFWAAVSVLTISDLCQPLFHKPYVVKGHTVPQNFRFSWSETAYCTSKQISYIANSKVVAHFLTGSSEVLVGGFMRIKNPRKKWGGGGGSPIACTRTVTVTAPIHLSCDMALEFIFERICCQKHHSDEIGCTVCFFLCVILYHRERI